MTDFMTVFRAFQARYGYQTRPAQDALAEGILDHLDNGVHTVPAEAPTGSGKSLMAVLMLTRMQPFESGRLVVATATRAQARQYRPIAQQAVDAGLARSWHILYGSAEYLCARRRRAHGLDDVEDHDTDGSRSALAEAGHLFTEDEWRQSRHDSDICDPDLCGDKDFYFKARRAAVEAKGAIIIATQARVAIEAKIGNQIFKFGDDDVLMVDEGHQMANTLRNAFGTELSVRMMRNLVEAAAGLGDEYVDGAREAARLVSSFLSNFVLDRPHPQRRGKILDWQFVTEGADTDLRQALQTLSEMHAKASREWRELLPHGNAFRRVLQRRLSDLQDACDPQKVRWVAQGERARRLFIKDLDTEANHELTAGVFGNVLVTSATLTGIPLEDLGLGSEPRVRVWSDFDLENNRRLVVLSAADEQAKADLITRVVEEVDGGVLVIAKSSNVRLGGRWVPQHEGIAAALRDAGHRVGLQQTTADVPALAQSLRDRDLDAVVGLASVREGLDIPGKPLSCVVLPQLPWPNMMDPILIARTERDGDQWRIPRAEMEVNTRQAIGRLIRTHTDTGVVVLLDARPSARNTFLRLAQEEHQKAPTRAGE